MSEFCEVIKQRRRMCYRHHNCIDCPIYDLIDEDECADCNEWIMSHPDRARCIIMSWANHYPERYPTWHEWQEENFPNRPQALTICNFDASAKKDCIHNSCVECLHSEIPEHLAKIFNLKKR